MKIGILTFHYAHNYGAVLQAYALKKYLSDLGHETSIIDYKNESIVKSYPYPLKPFIRKKDILFPTHWVKIKQELIKTKLSKKEWHYQYQKFELFIKKYLSDLDEWESSIKHQDIIFFGSDQIWEPNLTGGYDPIYLGYFDTRAKKISYAASCFSVTQNFSEFFQKGLNNFDHISVREEALASALSQVAKKEINVVADPVLLLNKEDYKPLIKKENDYKNYILFYFVSENTILRQISDYLRNQLGEKVIEIHYFRTPDTLNEWQKTDVGPEEFITLIYNAKQVFTNSFHGTAFSILFEKQFYTVSQNIRILNLLEKLSLSDRNLKSLLSFQTSDITCIQYEQIKKKKENYLKQSKDYINMVLNMESSKGEY